MRTLEAFPPVAIVAFLVGCSPSTDRQDSVKQTLPVPDELQVVYEWDFDAPKTDPLVLPPKPLASRVKAVAASATRPVIFHLRTRVGLLTVRSGEKGLEFEIATSAGEVLENELTPEELQQRHPGFFQLYTSSVAENGILDASLWPYLAPGSSPESDPTGLDASMWESVDLDASLWPESIEFGR